MIKVTYFNRDKRIGNYSIEEIFAQIQSALQDKISIKNYYLPSQTHKIKGILEIKKIQGDVNHITGDVNFLAFGLIPNKTILTVHDIGHYENTLSGWKKNIYKYMWLKWPLTRVKYITTISEFTKTKLVSMLGVPAKKIKVIYDPYPSSFRFHPKEFNKKKTIILQIGSGHNKNVERLIEAVRGMSCKLLMINRLNERLIHKLKEYTIDYDVFFNLSFKELYQKYLECDLVYFVSTYEGFGLPIVEAQAVGRAVITSNIAAMPEIAGDAACITDPYDVSKIRNGILKIINDENYRTKLIEKGLKNIKKFEVGKIANQYLKLYEEVEKY